ncbi:hypothetical protein DXG01_014488 [Tephrocybe rancida]|nr:hypothetical protein DXG01_014488 [Tephrocybe rancida]
MTTVAKLLVESIERVEKALQQVEVPQKAATAPPLYVPPMQRRPYNNQSTQYAAGSLGPGRSCLWCGLEGHYIIECLRKTEDLKNGIIKLNHYGRVALPDGSPLPRVMGKSMREGLLMKQANQQEEKIASYLNEGEDKDTAILRLMKEVDLVKCMHQEAMDALNGAEEQEYSQYTVHTRSQGQSPDFE